MIKTEKKVQPESLFQSSIFSRVCSFLNHLHSLLLSSDSSPRHPTSFVHNLTDSLKQCLINSIVSFISLLHDKFSYSPSPLSDAWCSCLLLLSTATLSRLCLSGSFCGSSLSDCRVVISCLSQVLCVASLVYHFPPVFLPHLHWTAINWICWRCKSPYTSDQNYTCPVSCQKGFSSFSFSTHQFVLLRMTVSKSVFKKVTIIEVILRGI